MKKTLMLVAAGLIFAMIACGTVASLTTDTFGAPAIPLPTATAYPTPAPYLATLTCPECGLINLWEAPSCETIGTWVGRAGVAGNVVKVVSSDWNECGYWSKVINQTGASGWLLTEFLTR